MNQIIFVLILLLAVSVKSSKAQTGYLPGPFIHEKSLRFNTGTQGIGTEFYYGTLPRMALRIGVNFIPISANNVFNVSGLNSTSKLSVSFSNVHLLADFTPFEETSGLRLVTGGAYFMNATGRLQFQPSDSYTYGDILINKNEVGKLNMNVNWKGFAPYLGIGLLNPFPNEVFNINIDIGSYYLKSPDASIVGTGILVGNSSQTSQLQQNVKSYRFLPVVQANFNFKL
jgi:hypothetical protein